MQDTRNTFWSLMLELSHAFQARSDELCKLVHDHSEWPLEFKGVVVEDSERWAQHAHVARVAAVFDQVRMERKEIEF